MTAYALETLFPREIEARLAENPILVLPFGTIEWHSHHLPVGLDGIVGARLGREIAERADAVLAPTSYWAVGGVPFPHTLNLPIGLVEPLIETVYAQFTGMGFKVVVGFTGHFGLEQTLALKRAALAVMRRSEATILPLTEYDPVTDLYTGDHAGIGEASLLWAERPDLVRLDAVGPAEKLDGVIGEDPRGKASLAYGEQLAAAIGERSAATARRVLAEIGTPKRAAYLAALTAGVEALELTQTLRGRLPKSSVPPIATPDYLDHCAALVAGDYERAETLARAKVESLRALSV